MKTRKTKVLILCKTYPSPSSKYSETSCVAGMEEGSTLLRLFPVPFRLINDDRQFKKWQIIECEVAKARDDRRKESHHIQVDSIQMLGPPVSTRDGWLSRLTWLNAHPIHSDFASVEAARQTNGDSLAFLRPEEMVGLEITPATEPDWTDDERSKLLQHQRQGGLFDPADARQIKMLRKLPYDFHYRYRCRSGASVVEYRHKIVDWEAGALYWNCRRKYGAGWEEKFREKMERMLPAADLIFLMGTIHRFPDQWLIVSLIYPPRRQPEPVVQPSLFDQ